MRYTKKVLVQYKYCRASQKQIELEYGKYSYVPVRTVFVAY